MQSLKKVSEPSSHFAKWEGRISAKSLLLLITLTLLVGFVLGLQGLGNILHAAPFAASQSTTLLPYQGRLTTATNQPVTQTVNMVFRLYNSSSGGTPLWEEQWTGANGIQVNEGLFNVMLGSITPIPATVAAGNSSLFLGITIGTDGEMSPRVQLGSVPFAMQAQGLPNASITGSMIQNTSIGKEKLVAETYPNIGVLQEKVVANVLSISADVEKSAANDQYVDLLSQSVTITEPSVLRINYHALAWKTAANGRIALGLRLDGVANTVPPVTGDVWNSWIQVGASISNYWVFDSKYLSNVAFIKVAPGTHTVSLVLGSWDNGSVTGRSYAMDIEVMKQ